MKISFPITLTESVKQTLKSKNKTPWCKNLKNCPEGLLYLFRYIYVLCFDSHSNVVILRRLPVYWGTSSLLYKHNRINIRENISKARISKENKWMSLPEGFPCSVPSGQNTQWHNAELWGNMSISADSSRVINNYPGFFLNRLHFFPLMFWYPRSSSYITLTEFGGGSSVFRKLTWMWAGQGAEQARILIGSIKQLHWVIHRRLENRKLAKDHWGAEIKTWISCSPRCPSHRFPLGACSVIEMVLTKLWRHGDVVGAGLSGGVVQRKVWRQHHPFRSSILSSTWSFGRKTSFHLRQKRLFHSKRRCLRHEVYLF